jgi:hypothetical protein
MFRAPHCANFLFIFLIAFRCTAAQVTDVTFDVGAGYRVAGMKAAKAQFTFTPTAGGVGPSNVTLNYPSGFFATSATPDCLLWILPGTGAHCLTHNL